MNNNDIINEILSSVKQPMWGIWYIREKIGAGASATVFRGEAIRRNQAEYSAIKVEPITTGDVEFRDEAQKQAYLDECFNQVSHEATMLYKMKDSPNIVTYKDEYYSDLILNGKKEGYFFIRRMELLGNVFELMANQKFNYSEDNIKALAAGIGAGLATAHANGILHRDVAPYNFYHSIDNKYKLGGFNCYNDPEYVGQEDYMAPEIYLLKSGRAEKYDAKAEVFALGMCLYQMMNGGYLPFEGPNTTREAAIDRRMLGAELPPPADASKEFAAIIMKACAADPSARYQSVGQMLADLNTLTRADNTDDARSALGMDAYSEDTEPAPYIPDFSDDEDHAYTRPPRSNPNKKLMILLIAAIVALLAVAGVGLLYALNNKKDDKSSSETKTPAASSAQETTETLTEEPATEADTEDDTQPSTEAATADRSEHNDFTLDRTSMTLAVGTTGMPMVLEYPEGCSEADEVWTSDNEDVATVNEMGLVTAVGVGECKIKISSSEAPDKSSVINITVVEEDTRVIDLAASPAPAIVDYPGLTYIDGILVANKSYSVPADYSPGLIPIAQERFNALRESAAQDGLDLFICSGFRDYNLQQQLYEGYAAEEASKGKDGYAEADKYSARPGHSEHQTGLAMDINMASSAFEGTPEAKWLAEHCWEFGFIIRYPADKVDITGYKYEPWHLRYVGGELAKELTEKGICLEEYLNIDSKYKD